MAGSVDRNEDAGVGFRWGGDVAPYFLENFLNDYARQSVASLAIQLFLSHGGNRRAMIRQLLPYCAVRVWPDRDTFLLLNREYKPLGYPTKRKSFLDYQHHEYSSWRVVIDGVQLSCLGPPRDGGGEFFYFYGISAGDAPWIDSECEFNYMSRLRIALGIGDQLVTPAGVIA